ncbi:MAG: PilT protein domain protein [Fibrobacteres bacterium]|nr:PilT protein domain protein [Fibrobacterota bacterium]
MIFDTDIIIWMQRGNEAAAEWVYAAETRFLSIQSYMELIQNAGNKKQIRDVRDFLTEFNFTILPLTERIGHRASIYIEEYSLSHGIQAGDALIAATATENNLTLSTSNAKHFKPIRDLELKVFKP